MDVDSMLGSSQRGGDSGNEASVGSPVLIRSEWNCSNLWEILATQWNINTYASS